MKRLSNTLTTDFCIEAVQEAMQRYGTSEIFNTDRGSQFTSIDFTQLLKDNGIAISMAVKAAGATTYSWNCCGNRCVLLLAPGRAGAGGVR